MEGIRTDESRCHGAREPLLSTAFQGAAVQPLTPFGHGISLEPLLPFRKRRGQQEKEHVLAATDRHGRPDAGPCPMARCRSCGGVRYCGHATCGGDRRRVGRRRGPKGLRPGMPSAPLSPPPHDGIGSVRFQGPLHRRTRPGAGPGSHRPLRRFHRCRRARRGRQGFGLGDPHRRGDRPACAHPCRGGDLPVTAAP